MLSCYRNSKQRCREIFHLGKSELYNEPNGRKRENSRDQCNEYIAVQNNSINTYLYNQDIINKFVVILLSSKCGSVDTIPSSKVDVLTTFKLPHLWY